MSELRLVQGNDVVERLRAEGEVTVYTYRLNRPVFVLTLLVGAALLGLAGTMWWNSGLADAGWIAGFGALVTVGGGLGILAAYWYSYTQTHFLGLSDRTVFVGGRDRMWCIDWSLLDRETLGFEEMSVSSTGGALELGVGGEQIRVRLYNTFVHLEDLQGFMFRILRHLKDDPPDEQGGDASPEPDADTADAQKTGEETDVDEPRSPD